MESSFDQELPKFVSKDMSDLAFEKLEGAKTTKTNSGHPTIEKYQTEQVSNPNIFSVLEEHKKVSRAATLANALNLLIKEEPDINDYEIKSIPIEVPKHVYASECIKQECKLLEQLKNKVAEQMDNVVHIPYSHNDENSKLVEPSEYLKVIEQDEKIIVDNLQGLSNSTLNKNNKENICTQYSALVKMETISIKSMHENVCNDWNGKNGELDIKEDFEENKVSISQDCVRQGNQVEYEEAMLEKSDHSMDKVVVEVTSLKRRHRQHKYLEESIVDLLSQKDGEIFKCNKCDYQTKNQYNLKCHLFHHNQEQTQKFKCEQCSYTTIFKCDIKKHILLHRNPEEVEMFKCNNCDFQTKHKYYLKSHLLRHKSSEEVEMFKCNNCDYQSRVKRNLLKHMLRHNNSEEVEIFKCTKCDYQTKYKHSLRSHLLRHNPEQVQNFKCDKCSYKSIFKYDLKKHILQHRNPEEIEMFKCNNCDFKTKRSYNLKSHLLMHNNPEKVEMFKCNLCNYQSKRKRNLTNHMIRHNNPEEVDKLKCNKCDYQTNYKHNLKYHLLRHNPEQVQRLKCDKCPYKTIFKSYLKKHLVRHRNPGK